MTHTATTAMTNMNQDIRNQMSLMAWIMAALCGWVMFLSAHAISSEAAAAADVSEHYSTTSTAAHK
jgi:outer membrane lipoprotein-sorting protein